MLMSFTNARVVRELAAKTPHFTRRFTASIAAGARFGALALSRCRTRHSHSALSVHRAISRLGRLSFREEPSNHQKGRHMTIVKCAGCYSKLGCRDEGLHRTQVPQHCNLCEFRKDCPQQRRLSGGVLRQLCIGCRPIPPAQPQVYAAIL